GLTMPREQSTLHQVQPEKLTKAVMQEYLYQNATDPSAYWPEKYWVTKSEGTASSHLSTCVTQVPHVCFSFQRNTAHFVSEDRYLTWRAGPYNSAAWNKYSTYLPLPPKVGRGPLYPAKLKLLRWDSSHFKKLGGVQRGSYTIHPGFASEMYYALVR
ncbi:hypothetical protein ASZ78_003810, partial [Callipepla squamata]